MNPYKLDLNLLRLFVALYKSRSVSKAATEIGLSQSAASNALLRLRRTCEDPLFVRTSEGMSPTAYCEALAPPVREALDLLDNSLRQTFKFDPRHADRTFRLLMSDAGETLILPKLMNLLRQEAPFVRIEAVKLQHDRYENALETGEADLAIGSLPFFEGRLYQQQLFHDHYAFIYRPGHRLFREGVTMEAFLEAPHIGISTGYADTLVEAALALKKVRRNVQLKVTTYRVACAIAATTDLVSTIPAHALSGAEMLEVAALPFHLPEAEVRQFWHRRFHQDPASRWMRNLVAQSVRLP